jgi:hypothetical protein
MSTRPARNGARHENDALLVLAPSAGSRARQHEIFVDARNAGFENMMRAAARANRFVARADLAASVNEFGFAFSAMDFCDRHG